MDHPRTHEAHGADVPTLSDIASLDRQALIDRLLHFDGQCRLDFTESFLTSKSTDRLRHILLAALKYAAKRCS